MRERHGLSQRTDLTGVAGEQRDALGQLLLIGLRVKERRRWECRAENNSVLGCCCCRCSEMRGEQQATKSVIFEKKCRVSTKVLLNSPATQHEGNSSRQRQKVVDFTVFSVLLLLCCLIITIYVFMMKIDR